MSKVLSNMNSVEENKEYLRSVLPVCEGGKGNYGNIGTTNWRKSIGYEIEYEYKWYGEVYMGKLKIINYNSKKHYLYFEYIEKGLNTRDLLCCKLGGILKIKTHEFKFEIGQVIKDEKRDMIIREIKSFKKGEIQPNGIIATKSRKWCRYECNIDGNEDWIEESSLKKGTRCNVCSNKKAMLGVNTIWDTDRYLVTECGLDEEFAKTHTIGTEEKGGFVCKYCRRMHIKRPCNVKKNNKSIGCICGDGYSYPEKFIYSMLEQLNIDFKFQLTQKYFKWIDTYKYDFYIPSLKLILETHGGQHGKFITKGELVLVEKAKIKFNRKNKREEVEVDTYKCWLAYNNGVNKYIQLDCGKSDSDYIKNSILNSELANIFDLSNIDWNKCEEFALKNIVKEVCDYWREHREINGEDITTKDLVEYFKITRGTIIDYLKQGNELGWCNYNTEEEMTKNGGNSKKKIYCIELRKVFNSRNEASKSLNINPTGISLCCKGINKSVGGYHFVYYEEYLNNPNKINEILNSIKPKKKVYCVELNKFFDTIKEAGMELGINNRNICSVLNGKRLTAGGYHWEYVEETEENN